MGKASRWFRSILGKKDQITKDHHHPGHEKQVPQPLPTTNAAKRWSFSKSSRHSAEEAAAAAAAVTAGAARGSNAAIARAAEAAWLRSAACAETGRDWEQSRHAIAVAAATAAAADAALVAAQAAVAVVRLTSKGRAAPVVLATAAAVRIQTAFRGFLAKKALRALKALVKLQALVRGYLVRRQAAATLQSMQALIRAQIAVRAHRAGAAALHHLPVRSRYSLERYADDTRSEHGAAAYSSRRLSASIESSSYGYDRSPKIVEVDPGRPKSCRASTPLVVDASSGSEEWGGANSVSSPLPCCLAACGGPPRIAVPTSRQFPDYDWCALEKARPATAQSTPRYAVSRGAPPSPAKSVAAAGYSPSLNCAPGYMSSTQSSEAKARSHSAPNPPPELGSGGARKRVPPSEVVVVEASRASLSGMGMRRSSCTGRTAQEAFNFKAAVVGRMDRALEVASENDRLAFLQRRW